MLRRLCTIILTICLLAALAPAVAGAAGEAVEIKLAIGSPTLSVNGVESVIQKPFQTNGTTMVPISVITKAFGAGLTLENNKIITLSYNGTSVILTIGSKTVKVNGAPITLTAEPRIVNNVTMVPLRVIVSAFGAALDLKGKQITIKGSKASGLSSSGNTGGINPDAGKTKIGDSYHNWSANYPSNLVLGASSDNGEWTSWENANGESAINIWIKTVEETLSKEELRQEIAEYFYGSEFAVEKTSIKIGGLAFEKIISRDRDGWFFEYRAIQQDNRLYIVAAGMKADNKSKLSTVQSFMDSFKPSFNKNDRSLKDITKVKDGFISFEDKEYGLSVRLPVDWYRDTEGSSPSFYNNDESIFNASISSLAEEDSAEKVYARNKAFRTANYAPNYMRNMTESSLTLKDGEARVLTYEYTWDTKTWYKQYDVLMVVDGFQYELDYSVLLEKDSEKLFKDIMASVDLDTDYVEENFIGIENEFDPAVDRGKTTKTSKKYGYSIDLNKNWIGTFKDFEEDSVLYYTGVGILYIEIFESMKVSDFIQSFRASVEEGDGKITKNTEAVTINGLQAMKLTAHFDNIEEGQPYVSEIYIFEKNGNLYALNSITYDAHYSEANIARMNETIQSFTFTN
ncbi:copper amine oxidase N-terminal domain-containing protein [Paenibacillus oenotherae]|uniref:Copper amine oxidase N-terminal domain-containing protein n=1 Tax=Paenibacillus oenotherae TaxID=1435645 RepID=A0ABS7D4W6_9BACL|nr:stalk domain-containing protein [Paenibacillus oenotherae]MBW7474948.1 copper amine oxidase N-terminal domain-containing protein [Paenibacillus oenotherae]